MDEEQEIAEAIREMEERIDETDAKRREDLKFPVVDPAIYDLNVDEL